MRVPGISARPKLVEPSGFSTPERAELALAIAAKAAAIEAEANLRRAAGNLFSARTGAEVAVEKAKAVLDQARSAVANHIVSTASGGAAAAPVGMREARSALLEAEDHLAATRLAVSSLDGKVDLARGDVEAAAQRVEQAVRVVLSTSPTTKAVTATVMKLTDELLRHGSLLLWLVEQRILLPRDRYGCVIGEDKATTEAARRMWSPPNHWPTTSPVQLQHISPDAPLWQAARIALLTDANAPLPGEV